MMHFLPHNRFGAIMVWAVFVWLVFIVLVYLATTVRWPRRR